METTDARFKTKWRQGSVIDPKIATALDLYDAQERDSAIAIVISHDCDIAAPVETEPEIELIIGKVIPRLGAATNAKVARRLDIEFSTPDGPVAVELSASKKSNLTKRLLILDSEPRIGWTLTGKDLNTLQHWLALRYKRAAFADEFQNRMSTHPTKLTKAITKIVKPYGNKVLALLFDVDNGVNQERNGKRDLYDLSIVILYDSDIPGAAVGAVEAAKAIDERFRTAFCTVSGDEETWLEIRLIDCKPVSDQVLTVAQRTLLKQWPLDDLSLREDPQHTLLD